MDTEDKIPLKLAEISIEKFVNTIPQYTNLLKNHKCNIVKCAALKDWDKVKREEINATRIIKQMKYLMLEMSKIRSRVQEHDLDKFDDKIEDTKKVAIAAMKEYLEMQLKSPQHSTYSFDGENHYEEDEFAEIPRITTTFDRSADELRKRTECLQEFESLQREIEDLTDLFHQVNEIAHEQAESVDIVETNVEITQINVEKGTENLRKALTYKKALYPICGALLGTCLGGPIGFVAGLKAGGLAAIGGGIAGFAGGKFIKEDESKNQDVVVATETVDLNEKVE